MPPPTHRFSVPGNVFSEMCSVHCFLPVQMTDLIGGVMTPPYG